MSGPTVYLRKKLHRWLHFNADNVMLIKERFASLIFVSKRLSRSGKAIKNAIVTQEIAFDLFQDL